MVAGYFCSTRSCQKRKSYFTKKYTWVSTCDTILAAVKYRSIIQRICRENNPREVFSIISILGLIMRRLASKLLSSVLCKTKLVLCKEYSSQGFSVELILILSKEIKMAILHTA